jgi:hypothetical protein
MTDGDTVHAPLCFVQYDVGEVCKALADQEFKKSY